MRDYGKVTPSFWMGETGKALRGDAEAQIVAMYLVTSPHANMIGVYHCPAAYIAHDTGLPFEGASKGLRRVRDVRFCTFDEGRDLVWVHEMARFQIAEDLRPKDNRIAAIARELAALPKCPITFDFFARYADAFLLHDREELEGLRRAFEGASEPLRSQEQEQEQKQEHPYPLSQGGNLSVSLDGRGHGRPLKLVTGSAREDEL